MSTAGSTPSTADSTGSASRKSTRPSNASSPGSSITTRPTEPASSIGTPAGAPGLAEYRSLLAAAAATEKISTQLLKLVQHLLGSTLAARFRIPDDPYVEPLLIGYDLSDGVLPAQIDQARELVEAALVPATTEFIIAELTRLRLWVDAKPNPQFRHQVEIYAEEIERAGYPADVVRTACRNWRVRFWPTGPELIEACDKLVRERRILQRDLRRGPNLHKPTAEEIAAREAARQAAEARQANERMLREEWVNMRYGNATVAEIAAWEWARRPELGGPDLGPVLTPKQALALGVVEEERRAAARRVAEGLKSWERVPLPGPLDPSFERSPSFAKAAAALERRTPSKQNEEEQQCSRVWQNAAQESAGP
jgi:hypothetical protein